MERLKVVIDYLIKIIIISIVVAVSIGGTIVILSGNWGNISKFVSLISNILTIFASGIAVYLFIAKRKSISSIFNLLVNYTYQLTLSELKEKLEKLNEYNAKEQEHMEHIVNIFNEIIGQIRGNDNLKIHFSELLATIETLVSDKRKLTEPRKRAVVSELRERLRNLNVKNIDDLVGEKI